MSLPLVPASTAKLFSKKRKKREIVSPGVSTEDVDKTVQSGNNDSSKPAGPTAEITSPAVEPAPSPSPGFRRR